MRNAGDVGPAPSYGSGPVCGRKPCWCAVFAIEPQPRWRGPVSYYLQLACSGSGLTLCNADLPGDQINTGESSRSPMLHLKAGYSNFPKEKIAVAFVQA